VKLQTSDPSVILIETFRKHILNYIPDGEYGIRAESGIAVCPPVNRIGPNMWTFTRQPFSANEKMRKVEVDPNRPTFWDNRYSLLVSKDVEITKPLYIKPFLHEDLLLLKYQLNDKHKALFKRVMMALKHLPLATRQTLACIVQKQDDTWKILSLPSLKLNFQDDIKIRGIFHADITKSLQ
jgi:hypothetical protein